MIRNCILYSLGSEPKFLWDLERARLQGVTLKDCLKGAKGDFRSRIEALMELSRAEKLSFVSTDKDNTVLSYSCKFRTRKPTAAGDLVPPFVPVEIDLWVNKKTPLVVTFDASRRLSTAATTVLSFAATGSPSAIRPVRIGKDMFIALEEWIISNQHRRPGQIIRATMQNVEAESMRFKQVVLRAAKLESSNIFNRFLESAKGISNLTFATPPLRGSTRSIRSKLNYWGGMTIYSPDVLPSEISELVGIVGKFYAHRNNQDTNG